MIRRLCVAVFVLALVAGMAMPALATRLTEADDSAFRQSSLARLEDGWIDLSDGWGQASACVVHVGGTDCFRTVAEAEVLDHAPGAGVANTAEASCSRSLQLFSSTYLSGNVLYVATRGLWVNLNAHGFDNVTFPFRVGACATQLASGSNGGGSVYKNRTFAASHTENTLGSSVYLYRASLEAGVGEESEPDVPSGRVRRRPRTAWQRVQAAQMATHDGQLYAQPLGEQDRLPSLSRCTSWLRQLQFVRQHPFVIRHRRDRAGCGPLRRLAPRGWWKERSC